MKKNSNSKYNFSSYAWVVVAISSLLLFYKYIMMVYPSLITDDIMRSFSIGATETGSMMATTFWTILITQLFIAGPILDKFGIRIVGCLSITISAGALIVFIVAAEHQNVLLGYVSRLMIGFGVSFATISFIKALSSWFNEKKFAFAVSFAGTAAMAGAIFGQKPLAFLIENTGSWQITLIICAFIGFAIAILYYIFIKENKNNLVEANENKKPHLKDFKMVIFNKNNIYLTLYAGLSFTVIDAFAGLWGNIYFRELYNISTKESSGIISMIFWGFAIGSPMIGKISEILDKRLPVMIFFHIIALVTIAIVLTCKTSPALSGALLFTFGFCLGIYMLTFAIGNRINSIVVVATVAAFINTGEPLFGALFDPLIGFFLDKSWNGDYLNSANEIVHQATSITDLKYFSVTSYQIAFSTLIISMIISLGLLFLIKDKK